MTNDQHPDLDRWFFRPDRSWEEKAACQGVDYRVFFPENTAGALDPFKYRRADAEWRQYCPGCPVKQQCENDAVVTKAVGVRGGKLFSIHGTKQKVYNSVKPPRRQRSNRMRPFPFHCSKKTGTPHRITSENDLTRDGRCRECSNTASQEYRERRRNERDGICP